MIPYIGINRIFSFCYSILLYYYTNTLTHISIESTPKVLLQYNDKD